MSSLHFDSDVDIKKAFSKLDQLDAKITMLGKNAIQSGSVMDNAMRQTEQSVSGVNNELSSMNGILASLISAAAVGKLITDISQVRGEFQKYEAVLTNTFNDEIKAAKSMEMISTYAAKTNFQVNELTDSYVRLVNQGFEPSREEMIKLGDLAASKAKGFNQLAEAIIDAETFEFERLKEFGIRAAKEGDQVTFTFKGIKTTVDASSESIRKYILSLGELQGVKGSTEAISKTIVGLTSNFQDAWDRMLNTIGKANEGAMADSIKLATELVENYDAVADSIKALVATYGAYKAAVIVNQMMMEVQAAGSLAKALKQTAIARQLLNVANAASPVGLALAGITALVGGYMVYQKHLKSTNSYTQDLNKSIADEVISLDSLFKKIKDTEVGTRNRADAIKIANDRYGDYLENLLTEKSTLEEIEAAQRNATNALIANISVQKSKDKLADVLGEVSDKFDKEFSGFITKFGEVYGTDRIPEFVTAVNNAIDQKIKEGGGQVQRGMLEYSNIAKEVYDNFINEISQKTGYLQYSFKDFQESFLDFAEFKAEKSGFVETLEGMITTYQGMIDKFRKKESGGGGTGGSGGGALNDFLKAEAKTAEQALQNIKNLQSQLGKGDEKQEVEIIIKINENQKFLDDFYKKVRDRITEEIGLALSDPSGLNAKIKPIQSEKLNTKKLEVMVEKQLTDEQKKQLEEEKKQWLETVRLVEIEEERARINRNISEGFKDASDIIGALSFAIGEVDQELGQALGSIADLSFNAANLFANISTGNIIGAVYSGIGAIGNIFSLINKNKSSDDLTRTLNLINKQLETQAAILATLSGNDYFALASKQADTFQQKIDKNNQSLKDSMVFTTEEWNKYQTSFKKLQQDFPNFYGKMAFTDWVKSRPSETDLWTIDQYYNAWINGQIKLNEEQQGFLTEAIQTQKELDDLMSETWDKVTGTTRDALADSIIEGFKTGSRSGADIMKTAVIEAFKTKLIEGDLTEWYKGFAEAGKDGFTKEEIDYWQQKYEEMIAIQQQQWDNIEKVTGVNPNETTDEQEQGRTGRISSMTEETGGMIVGQANAIRVDLKENIKFSQEMIKNQFEIMDQALEVFQSIERNTRGISRLENLENKIDETNRILKEKL